MAKLYKIHEDGSETVRDLLPKNGVSFSYQELREVVGGMVEIVPLPSGKSIVVNEEGKLIGLAINQEASKAWREEYPLDKYTENNDGIIAGSALIATEAELGNEEEEDGDLAQCTT